MIRIKIAGLPKMANGGHGSWQRSAGERKKWKARVARELVGLAPPRPYDWINVTFTRHSSVEPDYDGLVHGFKSLRDALVKFAIVVNDKNSNMHAVYRWEKAKQGDGHVTIDITEARSLK